MDPQQNFIQQGNMTGSQVQQQATGVASVNMADAVSVNNATSGRKTVDYIWQRGAVLLGVLVAGLLVCLIVALIIVVNNDKEIAKTKRELESAQNELNSIYSKVGVNDLTGVISRISSTEILNGGDLDEINTLLMGKFNANYKLDLADSNINFIIRNGVYKVVSLGVHRESGTKRAVLYEKIADGKWKLGGFDASKKDSCEDSTEEEKEAIKGVIPCEAGETKVK